MSLAQICLEVCSLWPVCCVCCPYARPVISLTAPSEANEPYRIGHLDRCVYTPPDLKPNDRALICWSSVCSACHAVLATVAGVLGPVSAVGKVSAAWSALQKHSAVWRKIFFLLRVKRLEKRAVMRDTALLPGSAVTQVSFTSFIS